MFKRVSKAAIFQNNATDVVKLLVGTAIAQAISLLFSPIVTRIYAPEAYGLLALFTSVTAIIGSVACLRYEQAIMITDDDESALSLLAISILASLVISALCAVAIWFTSSVAIFSFDPHYSNLLTWIVPLGVFFTGALSAVTYWNLRNRKYSSLSKSRIIGSSIATASTLGLGYGGSGGVLSLLLSSLLGTVISTISLGIQIRYLVRQLISSYKHPAKLVANMKQFRKFPLFDSWSTLLNTFSWQLPAILLNVFFTATIAGYYALGFRILQLPMSLLGVAIGQVFYQRATNAYQQNSLQQVVQKSFRTLILVGLFPLCMLSIVGRDLFVAVFGSNWAEAGVYVQILSPWAFFWLISSPLSTVFNVVQRQKHLLKWNIQNSILRFLALTMGGILSAPRVSIALFSFVGIVMYIYVTILILRNSEVSLNWAARILGVECLIALPGAFLLLLSFAYDLLPIYRIVFAISLYGFYGLIRLLTRNLLPLNSVVACSGLSSPN